MHKIFMVRVFSPLYHTGIQSVVLGPVRIHGTRDGNHGVTCIPCVNLKQVSATEGKGKGG